MEKIFKAHINKIIALTDDEFEYVMSHFSLKDFKKRDFLIRKGEAVKYTFWVVTGLL